MLSSAPRQIGPAPRRPTRIQTVCVVDPRPSDYQGWDSQAHANGLQLQFVATAEEALRVARTTAVDLWVVNLDLSGLSGCELCGMLRSRSEVAAVYLVANTYSPAAERAAWKTRVTLFGCKPTHLQWLEHWLQLQRDRGAPCRTAPMPGQTTASV